MKLYAFDFSAKIFAGMKWTYMEREGWIAHSPAIHG
jgi:hypothetical protein